MLRDPHANAGAASSAGAIGCGSWNEVSGIGAIGCVRIEAALR
jgi:hypothetical protein